MLKNLILTMGDMPNKTNSTLSDAVSLYHAVSQGDMSAYTELVKQHQTSVISCLRVRMNCAHEAEDLAQESFILAYEKFSEFDHQLNFGCWVRGIALNMLKNHIRKLKPMYISDQDELEYLIQKEWADDDELDSSAQMTALANCMENLSEKMQNLLKEHYNLGFSVAELTKKYNVQHSAMTMRMFRVREKLRQCIEQKIKAYL